MANGTPLPKATELFNLLSNTHIEDVVIARQYADELLQLDKLVQGDFTTKVSLAEALLLSGRRDDAIKHLEGAFCLRERGDFCVMDRLAILLTFVADREKALKVVKEIALEPGMFDSPEHYDNPAQIAAWAVDIEFLRHLTERDKRAGVSGLAQLFIDAFAQVGFTKEIAMHQRVLVEAVRDVQMASNFVHILDECGHSCFINNVLFDETKITRRKLEERVSAAITFQLKGVAEDVENVISNVFTAAPTYVASRGLRIVPSEEARA